MNLHTRAVCAVCLLCGLAFSRPARAAKPIVDPLADPGRPTTAPAFRQRVTGKDWDTQFAAALAKLGDFDQLAKSAWPAGGMCIARIDPKGPGNHAGLVKGGILTAIDGQSLVEHRYAELREEKSAGQQFTMIGLDGIARKIAVPAGLMGFELIPVIRPELVYLRDGHRGAAWDAYAAVGAAVCCSHPVLSETAWNLALHAGYVPDAISDYCAVQVSWRQGRNDQALAFAAELRARSSVPPALNLPLLDYQLSAANFKITRMMESRGELADIRKSETDTGEWLLKLIDSHHDLPEAQRLSPSPSELAAASKKNDLLPSMEPVLEGNGNWDKFRRHELGAMATHFDPITVEAPSARLYALVQVPKIDAPDVELVIKGKTRGTDHDYSAFGKVFCVGLVNGDDPKCSELAGFPGKGGLLAVTIYPTGRCLVTQSSAQRVVVQQVIVDHEIDIERQFTLRLLHVAGRDEVWINQRRLLYLPAGERPVRTGFFVGAVGTTSKINVDFNAIDTSHAKD